MNGPGCRSARLSLVKPPFKQPRALRQQGQPVRPFQHLVFGQTVAAPFLVVEVHEVEHPVPAVEYVDCTGFRIARDQSEEEGTGRKLNPTNDLSFGTLRQPSAGLV